MVCRDEHARGRAPSLRSQLDVRQWQIATRVVRGLTGYEVGTVEFGVEVAEILVRQTLDGWLRDPPREEVAPVGCRAGHPTVGARVLRTAAS